MGTVMQQGYYGKLPVVGDFVTRRLPKAFVSVWDQWLQAAIAVSQEQLGDAWLDAYLFSPIWRFGLSPGVCGEMAWAGVLMPSVDKVNRHYPLTMAFSLQDADMLPYLFGTKAGEAWFKELENLALSCLDGLSADALDARLQAIHAPRFIPACSAAITPSPKNGANPAKPAFHVTTESFEQQPSAFLQMTATLLKRFMLGYSYWSPFDSDNISPALLVCEGLPPIDAYIALLTGDWGQRGWALQSSTIRVLAGNDERHDDQAAGQHDKLTAPFFDQEVTTRPRQSTVLLRWRSWGLSVVGMRRKLNEDAMIDRSEHGLWAVADGMGGHKSGDVASRAIVEALSSVTLSGTLDDVASRVDASLQGVNLSLCQLAADSGEENQIIGSTVVVLLAQGNECAYLWAGDSRLYRFREGKLEQLTQDHSLYGDFAREGLVSPVDSGESGRCNIITRAVGAGESLQLAKGKCLASAGDFFLLCSDGLDKELTQDEIEMIFSQNPPEKIANVLIEQAERRGARDNVTVMVAEAVGVENGV